MKNHLVKNRIVLVEHHDNPPDDRVTTHLTKMGYDLDLRRPMHGDKLNLSDDVAGAVLFGGLYNVHEMEKHRFLYDEIAWLGECHRRAIPLLGICLGAQLIAHAFGARVTAMPNGACEFGYYRVTPTAAGRRWMPHPLYVTEAHFYQFELPSGAVLLARGEHCAQQAFRYGTSTYAVQFHPEVTAEIFQRWQNSDWALFTARGAQPRAQQNALAAQHDAAQHAWFIAFLERLFRRNPSAATLAAQPKVAADING